MASSCKYPGCRVPVEDGSEFCIFHDRGSKDLEKFQQALNDQINEVGPEEDRNGRCFFIGYVFPTGIVAGSRGWSQEPLIELPAKMEEGAWFDDATIKGNAWFDGATIEMDAAFDRATIKGNASFDGATIKGNARFGGATIEGNASFSYAKIEMEAWFIGATIKGNAVFGGATIKGNARFGGATIKGGAWFNDATIEGDAWFTGATIKGVAKFDGAECMNLYHGKNKPRIRGWGNGRCGIALATPQAAVSYWRFAQGVFGRTGEREKADVAFYFERLNRWRVQRHDKADDDESRMRKFWTNWVIRPGYWILFLLDLVFVRWTTAYGASVARLFFTWFVVIAGFGVTFSMLPRLIERAGESVWTLRNWIIGIHYSVTTFATLGLGHIGPGTSRLGMVLTSIEAILGAVFIALAVLVIGRRFMRQG